MDRVHAADNAFQFVWILGAAVAAIVATGLWSLARMQGLRAVAGLLVVASVAFNVYAIVAVARTVRDGEEERYRTHARHQEHGSQVLFRDVWFPAMAHARLGRILCEGGQMSLHGHLAYIVDKDLGLDALFACNDRTQISLVGSGAAHHYVGMTRPFWAALGAMPECWSGSLGAPSWQLTLERCRGEAPGRSFIVEFSHESFRLNLSAASSDRAPEAGEDGERRAVRR